MEFIRFEREIRKSTIEQLLAKLRLANAPRTVYISSPGGSFEFFATLGPAIAQQGITTLSGNVYSAAIILFLLGHKRVAFPDATFFFHEVRSLVGSMGEITIADLEEIHDYEMYMEGQSRELLQAWRNNMKAAQSWFLRFLSDTTRVSTSTFLDLMRNEATLSAREAMRYNIVHEVVPHDLFRNKE